MEKYSYDTPSKNELLENQTAEEQQNAKLSTEAAGKSPGEAVRNESEKIFGDSDTVSVGRALRGSASWTLGDTMQWQFDTNLNSLAPEAQKRLVSQWTTGMENYQTQVEVALQIPKKEEREAALKSATLELEKAFSAVSGELNGTLAKWQAGETSAKETQNAEKALLDFRKKLIERFSLERAFNEQSKRQGERIALQQKNIAAEQAERATLNESVPWAKTKESISGRMALA